MLTLKQVQEQAKEVIVNQDEAIKAVSTTIYKHILKLHGRDHGCYFPSTFSVLLYGETGCGKTHITKTIAELSGVPFIELNCKSICQEGWSGRSFIDLVNQGIKEAGNPSGGIIFLDEFDKMLCKMSSDSSDDVNYHLQASLLKYVEGTKVGRTDFKNFVFVFAGAFVKLDIDKEKDTIGFNNHEGSQKDLMKSFIDFGLLPELAGRINYFCKVNSFNEEQYLQLMEVESFQLNTWIKLLKKLDIKVNVDYNLKKSFIDKAIKKKLGVRGLIQVVEEYVNEVINDNIDDMDFDKLDPLHIRPI